MKKIFSLSMALLMTGGFAFANPVSLSTAKKAATNFMKMKTGKRSVSLTRFDYLAHNATQPDLYIFTNTETPGFVIISGDDVTIPVLGYSVHNKFYNGHEMSPEVTYWLNNYSKQIDYIRENDLKAPQKVTDQWNQLLNSNNNWGTTAQKTTGVTAMLTTEWGQWVYGYNKYCPAANNATGKAPAGCVATAMAQVMKYWNYPVHGTGSHTYTSMGVQSADFGNTTYDWQDMPDALNNNSTTTEVDAIATLQYQCGVAVEMSYSADGSGAYVINYGYPNMPSSQNALPEYFGYSSNIEGLERSNYNDQTWINLLKNELDNGRPLIYTGQGNLGGHAFVFDGYDNQNMFHINWGWRGSSNGYYSIDNLDPPALGAGGGGNGNNFNQDQGALIEIQPANGGGNPNPSANFNLITNTSSFQVSADTVHVGDPYQFSVTIENIGGGNFDGNTHQIYLLANLYNTNNFYNVNGVNQTIAAGGSYNYSFSTSSLNGLNPGDYIMICAYDDPNTPGGIALMTDSAGNYVGMELYILQAATGVNQTANNHQFTLYPNPADQNIFIRLKGNHTELKSLQIFDASGRRVLQKQNLSGQEIEIPVGQLASGLYQLKLETNNGTTQRKLVIRH